MKKKKFWAYFLKYLIAFGAGAFLLSTFSLLQKKMLGISLSLAPKAFIIPVLFGGLSGLIISIFYIRLRASREQMRDFINNIDDLIQIISPEGDFIFVNKAWHTTMGYSPLEIQNLKVFDIIHPAQLDHCTVFFHQLFRGEKEERKLETVFLSKNGESIYLEGMVNCRFENGEAISTRSIFRNVGEEYKARDFQKTVVSIFEKTREGVAITDKGRAITFINNAFTKITGYSEKEALGKSIHQILPNIENVSTNPEEMKAALKENGYWQGELWTKRKNAEKYPLQITINAISNTAGKVTNYACLFSDIGERKESEKQMQYLATHDTLTDLPNREMFFARAKDSILKAKEKEEKLAVLFLDLDGFKYVNDQYGHHAGDLLLKLIAKRLRNRTREEDIVSRFGGDEFAILLNRINSVEEAKKTSEAILKILASPFNLGGFSVQITASIGISLYTDNTDIAFLLIEADKAMYEAKRLGKNRVYFIER